MTTRREGKARLTSVGSMPLCFDLLIFSQLTVRGTSAPRSILSSTSFKSLSVKYLPVSGSCVCPLTHVACVIECCGYILWGKNTQQQRQHYSDGLSQHHALCE